jgi:putative transposase
LTEADYARLLDAAPPAARRADPAGLGHPQHPRQRRDGQDHRARPWLTVYRLPPYAHELNPDEPVWAHLKRSLANLTKHAITELTALAQTRMRRVQHRPGLLEGLLASTGLDLTPV